MLKFAIVAAAALTAATPVLAQSQLERSLGVSAGAFTSAELAVQHLKASTDSFNERSAVFGEADTMRFSTSNVHSARAQMIFDRLRAESREDE